MISVAKGIGQWKHMKKKDGNPNMSSFVQQSQGIIVKKLYNPIKEESQLIEEEPANFLKTVADNKDITKSFYLLGSVLAHFHMDISRVNEVWSKYSYIWLEESDHFIKDLTASKPKLGKYEELLHDYQIIKSQILNRKRQHLKYKLSNLKYHGLILNLKYPMLKS